MKFAYLFALVSSQRTGSVAGPQLGTPTEEFPTYPDLMLTSTRYSKETGKPRGSGSKRTGVSMVVLLLIPVLGMMCTLV
jgi:hypothetical protein